VERLNKFLAHAGIGSRRHCDELISEGHVTIDGERVRDLGTQIDPDKQEVVVDGQSVRPEQAVYWLVNKPRGYLSTNYDPSGRPRVIDLVAHVRQRVYTVGRLDEDSEGLILLTNDGELANRLMHPRYGVEKTYIVQVAGSPTRDDLQQLLKGVWLSDGHVHARRVKRLRKQGDSTWLEIVLSEGKNREIRRMLARLNHKIMRLKRIAIGSIRLGRLRSGKSRRLAPEEVERLRRGAEFARRAGKTNASSQPEPEMAVATPGGERSARNAHGKQDRARGRQQTGHDHRRPRPPRRERKKSR
jgi:23S rRNA pseudouridine2605 synthase